MSKNKETQIILKDELSKKEIVLRNVIGAVRKIPGVEVEREEFLRKELRNRVPNSMIEKAIATSPYEAGISLKLADDIANDIIKGKIALVTGSSFLSGMPGGIALPAGIAADTVQFYAQFVNLAEKLMYIYGFRDLKEFRSSQEDIIILMIGIASGVEAANVAVKALLKTGSEIAVKRLTQVSLKSILQKVSAKIVTIILGKQSMKVGAETWAKVIVHSVPIVGGIICGGISLATFPKMAKVTKNKLRESYNGVDDVEESFKALLDELNVADINDIAEEDTVIDVEYVDLQ